jgi:hypothetical protein
MTLQAGVGSVGSFTRWCLLRQHFEDLVLSHVFQDPLVKQIVGEWPFCPFIHSFKKCTERMYFVSLYLYSLEPCHYGMAPSSGCGWRRRPPDVEGSCKYIEVTIADKGLSCPLGVKDQHVANVTQDWASSCEYGNEPSGSIEGGEFFGWVTVSSSKRTLTHGVVNSWEEGNEFSGSIKGGEFLD